MPRFCKALLLVALCAFLYCPQTALYQRSDRIFTQRTIQGVSVLDPGFFAHRDVSLRLYEQLEQADPTLMQFAEIIYVEENNELYNSYTFQQEMHFEVLRYREGVVEHELCHIFDNHYQILQDPAFLQALDKDEVNEPEEDLAELWVDLFQMYLHNESYTKQKYPHTYQYMDQKYRDAKQQRAENSALFACLNIVFFR